MVTKKDSTVYTFSLQDIKNLLRQNYNLNSDDKTEFDLVYATEGGSTYGNDPSVRVLSGIKMKVTLKD